MKKGMWKKVMSKLAALSVYLLILLYVTGFQWKDILDGTGFGMVVLGMVLLSVPQGIFLWKRKGRKDFFLKEYGKELVQIFARNGLAASCIAAVLMLQARLYGGVEPEQMTREIALGLRPVLYGLIFYVLFHGEDDGREQRASGQPGQGRAELPGMQIAENEAAAGEEEHEKASRLTPEQLCYFFRARGLTAREAEVASLLYQGYSNREIAAELYIAETTVKKHVTHILEKLKIEQRGQIQELVKAGLDLEHR